MAYLGNTPTQSLTILRLEARKSFSFGLYLMDATRRPVDLTGAVLTFTHINTVHGLQNPEAPLLSDIVSYTATLVSPLAGYARFDLQAAQLNLPLEEYPFTITLKTVNGYTVVIDKGLIALQQNTEFLATTSTFTSGAPEQSLDVLLQENQVIEVLVGSILPPGMSYLTPEDRHRLDGYTLAGSITAVYLIGDPAVLLLTYSAWLQDPNDPLIIKAPDYMLFTADADVLVLEIGV